MTGESEPVIELVHADIPRSDVPSSWAVVKSVDWKVDRGSFWAVGAFAGGGKTDLLLTAAGLQRPLDGELMLFGRSLRQMNEEELVEKRLKVAMIFSNGRLFGHLTIAENIALPLEYHSGTRMGEHRERIGAALEMAGLKEYENRLPQHVPRALHQRVALARALALQPEVLLVDNPLAGVDTRMARWWMDFLCAAHVGDPKVGRKMTIVVSTDDLRPWMDSARQFGILRNRQFEVVGGRDEVKSTSQEAVRDLLAGPYDRA